MLLGVIITKFDFILSVISLIMLEPYAEKFARTVLRGGKLELAYLSQPQIAAIM